MNAARNIGIIEEYVKENGLFVERVEEPIVNVYEFYCLRGYQERYTYPDTQFYVSLSYWTRPLRIRLHGLMDAEIQLETPPGHQELFEINIHSGSPVHIAVELDKYIWFRRLRMGSNHFKIWLNELFHS
jgi:hypothetical protein